MVAILFLISLRPAAAQANSDANYRALRHAAPAETYRVENIELRRDVGTLTLRRGQITFLTPVLNRVSMAVFNGEGRFQLKPAMPIEERYIEKLTRKPAVDETLDAALVAFTDNTLEEIRTQACTMALDTRAADTLKDFRRSAAFSRNTP